MEKRIKIKVNGIIDEAALSIADNGLSFTYKNVVIASAHTPFYPFVELQHLRQRLETQNIFLLINGSRVDVFPSNMTAELSTAYIHELGKPGTVLVDIFNEANNLSLIGTVAEQKEYRNKWIKSMKQLPPPYLSEEILWKQHPDNDKFYYTYRNGKLLWLFECSSENQLKVLLDGLNLVEMTQLPDKWKFSEV